MKQHWNYHNKLYKDELGQQWHFVTCDYRDKDSIENYSEAPIEIYFRNDARTYYGSIRFEHRKDNPYHFDKLTQKVMTNKTFQTICEAPESKSVWNKNWK